MISTDDHPSTVALGAAVTTGVEFHFCSEHWGVVAVGPTACFSHNGATNVPCSRSAVTAGPVVSDGTVPGTVLSSATGHPDVVSKWGQFQQ